MIEKATLEEMVQDLSQRVSRLESGVVHNYGPIEAKPATTPMPIGPSFWPTPRVEPVQLRARCAKCLIELAPVMAYCCPQSDCPTGLGGVSCTAVGSGATLAKVFGHGGPFGEDGALLAQGYSENQ